MKSNEERISLVHRRAVELRKARDKKIITANGCLCTILLLAVVSAVGAFATGYPMADNPKVFTASSLLASSAGGYVFTAVIAFMVGVIITVGIRKYLEKQRREKLSGVNGITCQREIGESE